MAVLLLDTSVASMLHPRKRGSTFLAAYEPTLRNQILAVSFQTVAELYLWAEQHRWGAPQRAALHRFIGQFMVIPYELELARTWARVMIQARSAGRRLEAGDAWIAATAVHRSIPLVTHDKDLTQVPIAGLTIISHA